MERKRKNPKSKRPEPTGGDAPAAEPAPRSGQSSVWPALDERELQMNDDYDWCLRSAEVQQTYQGKFVAAYKRQILGSGKNIRAAARAALKAEGCPPRGYFALVYIQGCPIGGPS
jgi:hypothetical protein